MITKFKTKNRILSLLLTLVLVAGVIPITHLTAYGATSVPTDVWTDEGNYDISWYDGSHYYTIKDAADLAGLAVLVNGLNGNTPVNFTYQFDMGSLTIPVTETISIENEIDL